MSVRKIPCEEFIEFVIENGLKNFPELVEKYPVEEMYRRLNRNIKEVLESRDENVIYSACYSKDNDAVCIVNHDKKFDIESLKEDEDKLHNSIHESIHALMSKRFRKKEKGKFRKIKNFIKAKSFYGGVLIRRIDNDMPIREYGIAKLHKTSALERNIEGFFRGEKKFKYKGSLLSRFFYWKKSMFYLSGEKGLGLEEGVTEWITQKALGKSSTYKNMVEILNQIEAVIGTRNVLEFTNGNFKEIREMLEMDKESFYELIYRMDESVRAEYRRDNFEKKLEILKSQKESKSDAEQNEQESESILDKLKRKMDLIQEDLVEYDSDERSNVDKARNYYKQVISQNLMRAEEILIDEFLVQKIYDILNKKIIKLEDVKLSVKIFEKIREFALNSEVSQSKFFKSKCYKNFETFFQEVGQRYITEYKEKIEGFSSEELEYAYELYDYFEKHDENSEFLEILEECRDKNFYENIIPEIQEKVSEGKLSSFENIKEFVNEKGVLLNEKAFWTFLLNRDLNDDELERINIEKDLYTNYGLKFGKENLEKDPYSEKYNIVVNGRFIGQIRKAYANIFLQNESMFDDKFVCDSSLNIEGMISYEEFLEFEEEKEKICEGDKDLAELLEHGNISLYEAEQIKKGEYFSSQPKQQADEKNAKVSFKSILNRIFRKKSIDIYDIENISSKIEENEK